MVYFPLNSSRKYDSRMEFRIADTFTGSLARLTGDEQKAVKTTAFDLQMNPTGSGLSFHKLDRARDKNFWSVRVSSDLRLIVHRNTSSLLLCYVDHHDQAYRWAERRKLETHPTTGAAQFVEIRELVQEIVVTGAVSLPPVVPKPGTSRAPLFALQSDDELLRYGVPPEWLPDVRAVDEDSLLAVAAHLPAEAAEALLSLATGGTPRGSQSVGTDALPELMNSRSGPASPFNHPDAQRRFRIISDSQELERALSFPWDQWAVFLHPAQSALVGAHYRGPARVTGSAGTGKTIVALHRAVHLARADHDARVLLTTFSDTLANSLRGKLRRLISNEARLAERLEVDAIVAVGKRLFESHFGRTQIASADDVLAAVHASLEAAKESDSALALRFGVKFVLNEWLDVVDAWQLGSWEAYRDIKRLGRKTRLTEQQREALWRIFEGVSSTLHAAGKVTHAELFTKLAGKIASLPRPPFDYMVIDEAQDLSVSQLRFLAAIGSPGGRVRMNSLFFAGDLGQRIFQTPFSWKSLGVDVRGRSRTLHVNYRTSYQIRRQADRLLGPTVSDVDGLVDDRRGTVSVFNGPAPEVSTFTDEREEIDFVAGWLRLRVTEGATPREIAVVVRSAAQIERARAACNAADVPFLVLDEQGDTNRDLASVCTMHLAKGLEFRAVVVMACDDEIVPLQERIESVADETDLEEVYSTERHLLYVALTRARDHLLVTGVDPASEFLDDIR